MNSLKNKLILFLLVFIATLQVGLVFRIERLIRTIEAVESAVVVVEQAQADMKVAPSKEVIEPEDNEIEIQPRINCRLNDDIQQMIVEKCEEYNIDFAFVMAVIFKESSFRSNIISASNDHGLMQINKINHKWLSEKLGITDFLDPEQNVTAGLYMLHDYFEKYDHPALVLMAYNMGEPSAKKLWNQGIYTSDYAEAIIQQAEIYNAEIEERMGEK